MAITSTAQNHTESEKSDNRHDDKTKPVQPAKVAPVVENAVEEINGIPSTQNLVVQLLLAFVLLQAFFSRVISLSNMYRGVR